MIFLIHVWGIWRLLAINNWKSDKPMMQTLMALYFPAERSSRKSRTMMSWFWRLSWLIPSWPWSTGVKHLLPQLPVARKYLRNHGPTWLYRYSIKIASVWIGSARKTYHNVWVFHLSLKCNQSFLSNIMFCSYTSSWY